MVQHASGHLYGPCNDEAESLQLLELPFLPVIMYASIQRNQRYMEMQDGEGHPEVLSFEFLAGILSFLASASKKVSRLVGAGASGIVPVSHHTPVPHWISKAIATSWVDTPRPNLEGAVASTCFSNTSGVLTLVCSEWTKVQPRKEEKAMESGPCKGVRPSYHTKSGRFP